MSQFFVKKSKSGRKNQSGKQIREKDESIVFCTKSPNHAKKIGSKWVQNSWKTALAMSHNLMVAVEGSEPDQRDENGSTASG